MKNYRLYNIIAGWIVFLIAAFVYLSTIEPTTSLWDCGEFIASAYKLQVSHPPGAPFFMIISRVFSLFAGDDVTRAAMMVNTLSALVSAFTILFLFWTITYLSKKLVINNNDYSTAKIIAIIGSGLVGSLAYTFSDTFWFSAVEGEVYASSSFFTAIVFWAILKWDNVADEKYANRWLVLIAFLMGLSIGVHLLNLLTIPAIVFVYYFRKYKVTPVGVFVALLISVFILSFIQYGIIMRIVKIASLHELLCVNKFGMPYNSGIIIFLCLLLIFIITGLKATHSEGRKSEILYLVSFSALNFAIWTLTVGIIFNIVFLLIYSITKRNLFKTIILSYFALIPGYIIWMSFFNEKDKNELLKRFNRVYNLILICFTVILIGYASYATIVIRSLANPPMDENDPENVFSLLSYLNREQYGDRPLLRGQYFNAPPTGTKKGKPTYTQIDGKYKMHYYKTEYIYDKKFITFFPRMFSSSREHVEVYMQWADLKEKDLYEPKRDYNGNIMRNDYGKVVYDNTKSKNPPTFIQNLKFLFKYQIGHMYFRYFMWNFAGRQNDIQGFGSYLNGNWISGIPFIDQFIIGNQKNMPDDIKNHPSRNTYFFLPFILGFIGLLYHLKKDVKNFWVVMLLFILTGLAIVIYLNQTPTQPRERDYAYAGSFYAFTIWIGLGVLGIINLLHKYFQTIVTNILVIVLCLLIVPGIMASENWDDHDRSKRYTTRDIAYDCLNTCAPNAILFTNGDNDTFPLWYAQEVEGIRTDVRIVNLMLLNMDWYIKQMKLKAYESDPLPFSLTYNQYKMGTRDVVYLNNKIDEYVDIKRIMQFVGSDNIQTKLETQSGIRYDYIPTHKFRLPVDSAKVISNGTVKPADADKIVSPVDWTINARYLGKSELIVLDMLANNNWERPIYFLATGHEGLIGLKDYLQLEGFAYRLVPIKTVTDRYSPGRIDTEIMYDNLMNKFKWGGMNDPDVYLDNFHVKTLHFLRLRHRFNRLANEYIKENNIERAVVVLDKCIELTPHKNIPYNMFMPPIIESYYKCRAFEKANLLAEKNAQICDDNLNYYFDQTNEFISTISPEIRINLQILKNLLILSRTYKQNELAQKLEEMFNGYYQNYSDKMNRSQ